MVLLQPQLHFTIVRAKIFDKIPKFFGMVHLKKMAELVNQNIIYTFFWSHYDPPVDMYGAVRATASPSCFRVSKSKFARTKTQCLTDFLSFVPNKVLRKKGVGFVDGPAMFGLEAFLFWYIQIKKGEVYFGKGFVKRCDLDS